MYLGLKQRRTRCLGPFSLSPPAQTHLVVMSLTLSAFVVGDVASSMCRSHRRCCWWWWWRGVVVVRVCPSRVCRVCRVCRSLTRRKVNGLRSHAVMELSISARDLTSADSACDDSDWLCSVCCSQFPHQLRLCRAHHQRWWAPHFTHIPPIPPIVFV